MENNKNVELCNIALESVKDLLSKKNYGEVNNYINEHNEWGVGLELLIDTIVEEDIKISREQFSKLKVAMDSIGQGDTERIKSLMNNCIE